MLGPVLALGRRWRTCGRQGLGGANPTLWRTCGRQGLGRANPTQWRALALRGGSTRTFSSCWGVAGTCSVSWGLSACTRARRDFSGPERGSCECSRGAAQPFCSQRRLRCPGPASQAMTYERHMLGKRLMGKPPLRSLARTPLPLPAPARLRLPLAVQLRLPLAVPAQEGWRGGPPACPRCGEGRLKRADQRGSGPGVSQCCSTSAQ